MSARTARWIGALGALLIGTVALDVFPPLGFLELMAAIAVLLTQRPAVSLTAVIPTCLILSSAVLVMITVSGPSNPVMWPIVIAAGLTATALVRGGATACRSIPNMS